MTASKEYEIEITSAVVLDGKIVKPGSRVKVSEKLARNFLHRGKAKLPAGAEAPKKADGPIGTDGAAGAKRQGKQPADEQPASAKK